MTYLINTLKEANTFFFALKLRFDAVTQFSNFQNLEYLTLVMKNQAGEGAGGAEEKGEEGGD